MLVDIRTVFNVDDQGRNQVSDIILSRVVLNGPAVLGT